MTIYVFAIHTVTDAVKLRDGIAGLGKFAINTDVYIESNTLTQEQAQAIVGAAGDP